VRNPREAAKGKQTGRTQEIQRLIGRALRSVVNTKALGEKTIWIDCDVIQADGGTRTAAITGAYIALVDAVATFYSEDKIFPVTDFLAAVSVGLLKDLAVLDLCYEEDSNAVVDMNVVMTGAGHFVEVQGTGEQHPFTKAQMSEMLQLGELGVNQLIELQKDALGPLAWKVGRVP
uniref:ribonuclease PH n=1 Tax=Anaerospora hongkongensis TaxID=244830 RepID=UPI002FDADBCE